MIKSFHLYWLLVATSFRSQLQHRASFIMLTLSHFISTFAEIFGIWILFDRFKMIQGWVFPELALIYGIMQMGFAASESLARGFDTFSLIVKNGDFDRLLLRPLGTLFQVATRDVQLMRLGRFCQGLVILIWSFFQLQISFFSLNTLIILLAVIGTTSLFYGLFVLQATLSFWTVETLEIMNITTYGGVEAGQYPITIYPWTFRLFFTFIVPLACVAYYPIAVMLKHEDLPFWMGAVAPLFGLLFLFVTCQLWKVGVHHYHSTGN